MADKTVKCRICGEEYEFCYACERERSWRAFCDTREHYYIFLALMTYRTTGDAEEVCAVLRRRGIDPCDTAGFLPGVQKTLAEICAKAEDGEAPLPPAEPPADADGRTREKRRRKSVKSPAGTQ